MADESERKYRDETVPSESEDDAEVSEAPDDAKYHNTLFDMDRVIIVKNQYATLDMVCISPCGTRVAVLVAPPSPIQGENFTPTRFTFSVQLHLTSNGEMIGEWHLPNYRYHDMRVELRILDSGYPCMVSRLHSNDNQANIYICQNGGDVQHLIVGTSPWEALGARIGVSKAMHVPTKLHTASASKCGRMVAIIRRQLVDVRASWPSVLPENGMQVRIRNYLNDSVALVFEVYSIAELSKPIAVMMIITRDHYLQQNDCEIQWSNDGQLVSASYQPDRDDEVDGMNVYILRIADGKNWHVAHEMIVPVVQNGHNLGEKLVLGHAIRDTAKDSGKRCVLNYDYVRSDVTVVLDRFALDDAHQLVIVTALSERDAIIFESDYIFHPTKVTAGARHLLTATQPDGDGHPLQLRLHDLAENAVQAFRTHSLQFLGPLETTVSIADNRDYVAMFAYAPRRNMMHIYPRAEHPDRMVGRLAWMVAATSLRALRAVRRHPLRDCLLRPDTLGTILAMAGPLAGAVPCAKVTAELKRVAPLAQRLPDTRWGAAMVAHPTSAEMDAYIESLWE
jgi:hypothetical protein